MKMHIFVKPENSMLNVDNWTPEMREDAGGYVLPAKFIYGFDEWRDAPGFRARAKRAFGRLFGKPWGKTKKHVKGIYEIASESWGALR